MVCMLRVSQRLVWVSLEYLTTPALYKPPTPDKNNNQSITTPGKHCGEVQDVKRRENHRTTKLPFPRVSCQREESVNWRGDTRYHTSCDGIPPKRVSSSCHAKSPQRGHDVHHPRLLVARTTMSRESKTRYVHSRTFSHKITTIQPQHHRRSGETSQGEEY